MRQWMIDALVYVFNLLIDWLSSLLSLVWAAASTAFTVVFGNQVEGLQRLSAVKTVIQNAKAALTLIWPYYAAANEWLPIEELFLLAGFTIVFWVGWNVLKLILKAAPGALRIGS